MPKASKRLLWKAEYTAFLVVELFLRCLPLVGCYHLGGFLGQLSYHMAGRRRISVVRNLHTAFDSEMSSREIEVLSKEVFRRTGANIVSSIKTGTLSTERIRKCITLEGVDLIQPLIYSNQGVIAVLAHMGNWEILAQTGQFAFPDNPSAAFYRPLNNPYLNQLIKARRERQKNTTFSRRDGLAAPINHLQDRGLLGILTDQRVGGHGVLVPFFGRITPYTPLPDLLKRRSEANLVGVSVITEKPGKWIIRFLNPVLHESDSNSADVAYITEQVMRSSPADCFWLHDRWKLSKKPFERRFKEKYQDPAYFPTRRGPIRFGIVIESAEEMRFGAQLVEYLLKQQDDLHAVVLMADDDSAPISNSLKSDPRVTTARLNPALENDRFKEIKDSLSLLLTFTDLEDQKSSTLPTIALQKEHSMDETIEHLGANRIQINS
ncbi:MAG: hypothetical protein AAGA96_09185 [Verrucomicrobiota bacterium]